MLRVPVDPLYRLGPKNARTPNDSVSWFLEVPKPVMPFTVEPRWKNGWFDQSRRYSSRASRPSIILYSPVSVTSLRSCASPVSNPSRSLNHSTRGVKAHLLVGWKCTAPAMPYHLAVNSVVPDPDLF